MPTSFRLRLERLLSSPSSFGRVCQELREARALGELELPKDLLHRAALLYPASQEEADGLVDLVLELGGRVDEPDGEGNTPLHYACSASSLFMVRALLRRGADPRRPSGRGILPQFLTRDWRVVLLLLDFGADADAKGPGGRTLLHLAAEACEVEAVRELLRRRASPHLRDGRGQTPLHLAAQRGSVETARLLLEAGADPLAEDAFGETPFSRARGEVLEAAVLHPGFDPRRAGEEPITAYLRRGPRRPLSRVLGVRALLEKGADPRKEEGVLAAALEEGAYEVVPLLVEAGARVGERELSLGAASSEEEVWRALLTGSPRSSRPAFLRGAALLGNARALAWALENLPWREEELEEPLLLAARMGWRAAASVLAEGGGPVGRAAERLAEEGEAFALKTLLGACRDEKALRGSRALEAWRAQAGRVDPRTWRDVAALMLGKGAEAREGELLVGVLGEI